MPCAWGGYLPHGGLQSCGGVAVEGDEELPKPQRDCLEKAFAPYFTAIGAWLEAIHIGMVGGALYRLIQEVIPQERYRWTLCPGHYVADGEWMSSSIYGDSEEDIQSGTLFQTDILPSVPGYPSCNVESPVALADGSPRALPATCLDPVCSRVPPATRAGRPRRRGRRCPARCGSRWWRRWGRSRLHPPW